MKITFLSVFGHQSYYYFDVSLDLLPKLQWSMKTCDLIAIRNWKCSYNGKEYNINKNLLECVSRMTKAYPYEVLFNGIPIGFFKTLKDAKLRCQDDAFLR